MKHYPTCLTDSQWEAIKSIFNVKRKRKHSIREIFNAILYVVKTGCQWRMLPHCFPNWQLVYYYFSRWKHEGIIEQVNELLRNMLRKKAGKNVSPSLALIDSQSVKTTRLGGAQRGFDGGRRVKGRKRHIITDTMGLLLVVVVHAANVHDSKAAENVISKLRGRFEKLVKVIADGGYRGELINNTKRKFGFLLEVVLRKDESSMFSVIPKRWVVERTFAWLENSRRLSKDFEYLTSTSQAMVQLAMIQIMLNRIRN